MTILNRHAAQHLTLDDLILNRKVAQQLPPSLAFRYHAIPVGKANGSITVAMANPDDQTACEAIAAALQAELYVVQGDQATIDQKLAELWPEEVNRKTRLLVYHHVSPIAEEVKNYGLYLSDLLNGQFIESGRTGDQEMTFDELVEQATQDYDLVIFGEPCQSLIGRLLTGSMGCKAVERLPASVLIARCPRWPLKRLLLVTRGQGLDNVAVDWVIRLAQASGGAVTVLAVQPPLSGADSQALTGGGLSDWLTTDTPLGQQLRRIAQQLVTWEIQGKLRFRQGLPEWQIKAEVAEGEPDLIILAADPDDWWLRRILGRLVGPLLDWADRPVLIAKPTMF